jgi:hypothetical protein
MSISKAQNMGRIAMDDGTQYDVKVTYHNEKGEAVSCGSGSTLSKETQQELESLIKTMVMAHTRKASKTFKDLPVLHLDHSGITFPNNIVQSHELDLEAHEKNSLPVPDQTFTKVNQLWEKTSTMLAAHYRGTLDDCIEIPVSPKRLQEKKPTISIDLTVIPNTNPHPVQVSDPPPPYSNTSAAVETKSTNLSTPPHTPSSSCKNAISSCCGAISSCCGAISSRCGQIVRNLTKLVRKEPPPPPNLGALPENFDTSALDKQTSNIILQLPNVENNTNLLQNLLKDLTDNVQEHARPHGFKAIIQLMNIICTRLTTQLPDKDKNRYQEQLRSYFKEKLNAMTIAEMNTHSKQGDTAFIKSLWTIYNDSQENGLKADAPILTKASLSPQLQNLITL